MHATIFKRDLKYLIIRVFPRVEVWIYSRYILEKLKVIALYKHLFSLDEETTAIIREVPEKKKSAWVQDAIKKKAKTLEIEKETPVAKIPTVRLTV